MNVNNVEFDENDELKMSIGKAQNLNIDKKEENISQVVDNSKNPSDDLPGIFVSLAKKKK